MLKNILLAIAGAALGVVVVMMADLFAEKLLVAVFIIASYGVMAPVVWRGAVERSSA